MPYRNMLMSRLVYTTISLRSILILLVVQRLLSSVTARLVSRDGDKIPDYVTKYAPLVYLDQNEQYLPSDIQAQLDNTFVELNYSKVDTGPSPLLLSNLESLNSKGNCTVDAFYSCPLFLTSQTNVSSNPPWLFGVLPDAETHKTSGVVSAAIVLNDHGNGLVDIFYIYFYAFNLGNVVFGQRLGNHVGDWEHTMIRFSAGKPIAIWYSQHDGGQAFSYEAVSKKDFRPIVYSAIGNHANYAVPGTHTRYISSITVNDTTSTGPLWDPTLSAYYYKYIPNSSKNGTFVSYDTASPTSWLYFLGAWGDKRYPDSDPRQFNYLNLSVSWLYESGPTGPLDKNLNRSETCPDSVTPCVTSTVLPAIGGSSLSVTLLRGSSTSSLGGSPTTSKGVQSSSTGDAQRFQVKPQEAVAMMVLGLLLLEALLSYG